MPPTTPSLSAEVLLDDLLRRCVADDASDLHLTPGLAPHLRLHGELMPLAEAEPVTADQTEAVAAELLRRMMGREIRLSVAIEARGSIDGAITSKEGARFRFNLFRRQGEYAMALRLLEERFRTLTELGLPDSLYSFCEMRDGLVVISGPTGAGKSTTLAALLDHVNRNRTGHLITIEDPIEYLHKPVRCVINQRQVGLDAPSFNDALVASLRQDPDVVLVGEIRDLDTIRTAITAAETGHLVFTTLHAGDCVGSIERLVSVFPSDEQEGIRRQLSLVLRGVVAQHLLPGADGASRVASTEVMMVTPAVANLIATSKSAQIYSSIELGAAQGMQTMEQDLARLWATGQITETTAVAMARNVSVMRDRAAMLRRGAAGGNGGGMLFRHGGISAV